MLGETDLWKEIKMINRTCRNVSTIIVDAFLEILKLENLLASKREQLCNSVHSYAGW